MPDFRKMKQSRVGTVMHVNGRVYTKVRDVGLTTYREAMARVYVAGVCGQDATGDLLMAGWEVRDGG